MDENDRNQSLRHRAESSHLAPPTHPKSMNDSSYLLMPLDENNPNSDSSIPLEQVGDHDTRTYHSRDVNPPSLWRKHLTPQHNWWLFEILAALISIAAMLSLLAVLYSYNNTVVETLSPGITLNGVVAILSTICRTALMIPVASCLSQGKWLWFSPSRATSHGKRLQDLETFDSASRGSWGSLKLLWTLKAG